MKEYDSKEVAYIADESTTGRGSYGVVIPAFDESSQLVAIKCFSIHGGPRTERYAKKKMQGELENLRLANHEFVVNVYGWARWPGAIGIVMEYLSGGNLMETLRDDDIELGMLLKLRFCKEIASGISFIHNATPNKRLIHGDIKADNIMLTDKLICKIGDFGSARIASYTGSMTATGTGTENKFTAVYAAPELLKKPTIKLKPWHDTYSYSILVYIILTREMPVNNTHVDVYVLGVKERGTRPDIEDVEELKSDFEEDMKAENVQIIDLLIDIMSSCWKHDPTERPKMIEVKKDLESSFARYSIEEVKKQTDIALRKVDFITPAYDPSKCQCLYNFHKTTPSSTVSGDLTSSLVSRSVSEPATSSRLTAAPRRATSAVEVPNNSLTVSNVTDSQEVNSLFSVADLPLENSPKLRRQQSTAKFYEDVLEKIRAIKVFLKTEKTDKAIDQCNLLLDFDASLVPDKGSGLTNDVISLARRFKKVDSFLSARLIKFGLKICENVPDIKLQLQIFVQCHYFIDSVIKALYDSGNKNEIDEHLLSALELCHKKLDTTPNEDHKEKGRQRTICLLQIGQTYCFLGKYKEAKEASESCLTIMEDAYGHDAKDYRVYAMSYELKADASLALGEAGAKSLYKKGINMMKSANDAKDEYKEKWIKIIKEAIETPYSQERVWKYI